VDSVGSVDAGAVLVVSAVDGDDGVTLLEPRLAGCGATDEDDGV
jgi:hypothetical protein